MSDFELEQLDRELSVFRDAPVPTALRDRVVRGVSHELRRGRAAEWIGYAAAAAALFALWANLSWSAALREPPRHASQDNLRAAHADLVAQLHDLLPGLSAEEIERQADLLARHSGLPEGRRAVALGIRQF